MKNIALFLIAFTPAFWLSAQQNPIPDLKLEEEAYVNDIPFDTHAIANKYLLLRNMEISEEANIDDIPFNTEKIFYEKLAERLTEQYRNEAEINDLPDSPDYFTPSILAEKFRTTGVPFWLKIYNIL